MIENYPIHKDDIRECRLCQHKSDAFEWQLLHWKTNAGHERRSLVCTKCFDRQMAQRPIYVG